MQPLDPAVTRTGPLALIIQPDGTATAARLPLNAAAQLATLNEAVSGYLETIGPGSWLAFINGKRDHLRPNVQADALARALGWSFQHGDYLVGCAVFASRQGVEVGDVSEGVLALARSMHLIP